MSKRLSNVNNQALFNILASTILSGINFFTIPIFTRMLGPTNYGLYSIFHSWTIILVCILGMEAYSGGGTARYVFPDSYDGYLSSSLSLGTLSSAFFFILAFVFRDALSDFFGFPPAIVMVLFACAFANFVVTFAKTVFIYKKRAELNFAVSVGLSLATVALSLLFINWFAQEDLYLSRVYGVTIPYFVVAVVLWIAIFRKKPVVFNKRYWAYCLSMGLPLVFHTLANDLLKQANALMLQNMGFAGDAVGIYTFLCTYTGIVQIILTALNTSWCPFYYDDLNEGAFDKLKGKCRNYMELFTVLACGFLLLSREVSYLFADKEYWSGIPVIPFLVLGIYFIFMYQFPVNFEFYNRQTKTVAVGTIAAATINIILNLFLIPAYGMYGAAMSTAISYGLLFLLHFIIANHMKQMKFHMKLRNFLPGLVAVLVTIAIFYLLADFWYVRWGLGAVIGLVEVFRIWKRKSIF